MDLRYYFKKIGRSYKLFRSYRCFDVFPGKTLKDIFPSIYRMVVGKKNFDFVIVFPTPTGSFVCHCYIVKDNNDEDLIGLLCLELGDFNEFDFDSRCFVFK